MSSLGIMNNIKSKILHSILLQTIVITTIVSSKYTLSKNNISPNTFLYFLYIKAYTTEASHI